MNDEARLAVDEAQDDIGAEMRERELAAEPDDEALVGALFAQIGWLVHDLASPVNAAVLLDTDRDGLATTIHALDGMLLMLGTIRDEAAKALASLMEANTEAIAGFAVTRTRSDKVEWNKDRAWTAARHAIVDRLAINGGALDVVKAELIERTMKDVATGFSVTPKVTGLDALGVNAHEFRSTTPGRYNVKVV
jgi:hypothetical protein